MLLQAAWAAILIFFQRCWERDCTETYFLSADAGSLLLFLAAHVSLWRLLERQAAARGPLQQERGNGWSRDVQTGTARSEGLCDPPVLGTSAPQQQSHQLTAQAANWPCPPQL